MYTASVSNYRGISAVEVVLDRVALVAGPNGQGKTSLSQAVAAALLGHHSPGLPIKKNEAAILVHRGATSESAAKFSGDEGSSLMRWPSCEFSTNGKTPNVSPFAAGVSRLTLMKDIERAEVLADYLRTIPTPEELEKALADAIEVKPDDKQTWDAIKSVVKMAQVDGYDMAEKRLKDAATKVKGAWEQVTGRKYGSKIAQEWVPEGYDMFSLQASEEDLQQELAGLRPRREAAIAAQAVRQTNLAELDELALQLDAREAEEARLLKVKEAASEALVNHTSSTRPTVLVAGKQPDECPWCKGKLTVNAGKIEAYITGPTADEIAASEQALKDWEATGKTVRSAYDAATADHNAAKNAVTASKEAGEKADAIRAKAEAPHDDPDEVGQEIEDKEGQLAAIQSYKQAKKHAASVNMNLAAADVLAADGLRKTKLSAGLKSMNDALASMATVAKWQPVTITDDLAIRYGAFPYELCSESEKYRANIMLQIAMAGIKENPVVIIDAADILDAGGKNGLFALLKADDKRHYLVCMTVSQKEKVPNLAKFGLGRSYWIQGGQTEEIK